MSELRAALAFRQQGNLADAERACIALLRKNPDEFRALHLLGLLALQAGQSDRGIGLLYQSLQLNPRQPAASRDLGDALLQAGKFSAAIAQYDLVISAHPDQAKLFNNRGIALAFLNRLDEALASYDRALSLKCDSAEAYEAHNNRGTLLFNLRRFEEALADFDKAICLQPNYVNAIYNRGSVLVSLDRPKEALECCERILAAQPRLAAVHDLKGTALAMLDRLEEAVLSHEKAIALSPNLAVAYVNRANVLAKLDRLADALRDVDSALALNALVPLGHRNRAAVLHRLGRLEEALESHDSALKLNPNSAEDHISRAKTLGDLGLYDEALASYERALMLNPQSVEAQFGKSTALLVQGRFREGWSAYEWRRQRVTSETFHPLGRPQWSGREDISGKTIFVEAEQGMGDIIQFCRYLKPLVERGAQVIFAVPSNMRRLLQGIDTSIDICSHEDRPTNFDYHVPLMSLPMLLDGAGGQFFPQTPYLTAEPEKMTYWRDRIGLRGFRIGICWNASTNDISRSFPMSLIRELDRRPGVRFISLQKGARAEDLESIVAPAKVEVLGPDYDEGPDAFVDAAGVLDVLDLVITCDTAIAHLAGALSKPVWVALKSAADWRYLLGRDDSVWYPTMRLFRQEQRGNWQDVFRRISDEVGKQIADGDRSVASFNKGRIVQPNTM